MTKENIYREPSRIPEKKSVYTDKISMSGRSVRVLNKKNTCIAMTGCLQAGYSINQTVRHRYTCILFVIW